MVGHVDVPKGLRDVRLDLPVGGEEGRSIGSSAGGQRWSGVPAAPPLNLSAHASTRAGNTKPASRGPSPAPPPCKARMRMRMRARSPCALHDEAERGELAWPIGQQRLLVRQAARDPVKLLLRVCVCGRATSGAARTERHAPLPPAMHAAVGSSHAPRCTMPGHYPPPPHPGHLQQQRLEACEARAHPQVNLLRG